VDQEDYKRRNQERDAKREHKFSWGKFWKWRPQWWDVPPERFAGIIAFFTAALVGVAVLQAIEMNWAYGPAKISADAALKAVETTRDQISAYLSIPTDPQSTVRMKLGDFNVVLDLYVANIGQSVAHDTYFDMWLAINTPRMDFYKVETKGGPYEITTQSPPWHELFNFLPKPPGEAIFNALPQPGHPSVSGMLLVPMHNIAITLKGTMNFTNVFRESVTQPIDLVAQYDDPRKKCCEIMQLNDGVPLSRPFDAARTGGASPKEKPTQQK
jgi:hypothetical protein